MTTKSIRAIRLQQLRATHAEDAATKPAWQALQQVDAITADIDARRAALTEAGHLTAAGIYAELRPLREKHVKALRAAQDALKSSAEKLFTASQGTIELPADHQRILNFWTSLPPGERQSALVRAMSGKDPELAATLAHKSNERYVGLTPTTLQTLRSRYADSDTADAHVPRLAAHQIANEAVSETLATLEQ